MPELATPHRPTLDNYDRRRYRRYEIALLGRYMLESRREYPCQTIAISTDSLSLAAPIQGRIGERIIAYIDHLGRIEGEVTRHTTSGFGIAIIATLRKRDKLAATMAWLAERDLSKAIDDRKGARIVPRNPFSQLVLADGSRERCRISDLSISGAALVVASRPPVGTAAALGPIGARVIRHTDDGIAIAFNALQDDAELRAQF